MDVENKLFIPKNGLDKDYASINKIKDASNDHQFFIMIEGYKKCSFEILTNLIDNDNNDWLALDSKISPIIFLFRHFLELILKQTLRFEKLIKKQISFDELGFDTKHSLSQLWKDLKPFLKVRRIKYDKRTQKEIWNKELAIENMIFEIDKLDPGSFSFRYPFEKPKKGTDKIVYSLPEITIDIKNLSDKMNLLASYFEGINEEARIEHEEMQTI